jgi:hypothetical protein
MIKRATKILLVIMVILGAAVVVSKSSFIERFVSGTSGAATDAQVQLTAFFAWQALVVMIILTAIVAIILQFTGNEIIPKKATKKRRL